MRRKRDATEFAIVNALKSAGWLVISLDPRTNEAGLPDLIAIRAGRTVFIEVKSDAGRLRPLQLSFHERLRAAGAEVYVVHNVDELFEAL